MNHSLVNNLLKSNDSAIDFQMLVWKTTISNRMVFWEKSSAMHPGTTFEVLKKIEVAFENSESIPNLISSYIISQVGRDNGWEVRWVKESNLLVITPKYSQTDSGILKRMLDYLKKELNEVNENIQEANKILAKFRQEAEIKFQDVTI